MTTNEFDSFIEQQVQAYSNPVYASAELQPLPMPKEVGKFDNESRAKRCYYIIYERFGYYKNPVGVEVCLHWRWSQDKWTLQSTCRRCHKAVHDHIVKDLTLRTPQRP